MANEDYEDALNYYRSLTFQDAETTTAHQLLEGYLDGILRSLKRIEFRDVEAPILKADTRTQANVLRHIYRTVAQGTTDGADGKLKHLSYWLTTLSDKLNQRKLPFVAEELEELLEYSFQMEGASRTVRINVWVDVLRHIKRFREKGGNITPRIRQLVLEIAESAPKICTGRYYSKDDLKTIEAVVNEILERQPADAPEAGEIWADLALADIAGLPEPAQDAWKRLFGHLRSVEGSKPTAEWLQTARDRITEIGTESFAHYALRWIGAVTLPPVEEKESWYNNTRYVSYINHASDKNMDFLKGLAWCLAESDADSVAQALARLTEVSLKKIPQTGPWAVRVANATVWGLGEMQGDRAVMELSRLQSRLTYRGTLKQIDQILQKIAGQRGVAKEVLEDLAVPLYGLEASGKRTESFGECRAEVELTPTGQVSVRWFGKEGKLLKSVPASVKSEYADDYKQFKEDIEGLTKTLSAQRDRIERFCCPLREWSFGEWQQHYQEHPVLGHFARRLLWQITAGERTAVILPQSEGLYNLQGEAISDVSPAARVTLWHPILAIAAEIHQWRERLEALEIVQPFKQVYREVYLLTDAERTTRTYSNRYAGHILKQHQMNSLMGQRGWKNQLHLMVDDSYMPPTRELPEHGLRAEFWIEGAGNSYGEDTNDTGTYLYMSTDQVRFYRTDDRRNFVHASGGGYASGWNQPLPDPVPLEEIPPLIFSEVMRDIDLFVGVTSVGNDPNWSDGGPEGRYRNYWQDYAFGELSATAKTRAEVLTRLLPRLRITSRCSIDGRFLVVKGDLRTYKIHLGSGNILMAPNDQYLCIVEARSSVQDGLFLPFEGDSRLSLILSKAFMLADDKKITDPTITRQITTR